MRVKIDACRSCGARVIFCISASSGKSQIIDADPVEPGETLDRKGRPIPEGNIALEDRGDRGPGGSGDHVIPTAVFVGSDTLFGPEHRRVDHHATCPDADRWKGAS